MKNQTLRVLAGSAFLLALFFAVAGFFLSPGNAAIPVSLAFSFIGGLGLAVGRILRGQDDRIDRLERLLKSRPDGAV